MRLAQIARKVGMTPNDIKRFLESEFELNIGKLPNYKLDESQVEAVLAKFPIPETAEQVTVNQTEKAEVKAENILVEEDLITEVTEELVVDKAVAEEITETVEETEMVNTTDEIQEVIQDEIPEEIETTEELVTTEENSSPETTDIVEPTAKRVEINYDSPESDQDEDKNFVQAAVDRNAELIQAPKIKLDGLKILGKIELPETKKAVVEPSPEEIEAQESDAIAELDAAMQSQVQDVKPAKKEDIKRPKLKAVENWEDDDSESIYKDKNGIYHFSAEQRANRAHAMEKIEAKRRIEAQKERKKRHYEEKAARLKAQPATASTKKVKSKKVADREDKKQQKRPKPTTLWGKFVYWLND